MTAHGGRERIRLMQRYQILFYTPIQVAVLGGFFEAEGLDVEFFTCPPDTFALTALKDGVADIVQSGPMTSIIASDWGAEVVPAHFIEINSRDGFFLVGRPGQPEFQWDSLLDATLIPVGFSPMPPASLKYVLKRKGVDLDQVRLIDGLPLVDAMAAFRGGQGDFVHLPQPSAEELVQDGTGQIVAGLGPTIGHIAYSSFATSRHFLDARPDTVHRFTRGFFNAQKWLSRASPEEISETVAPQFPALERTVILRAVERYKEQDTWATDPLLRRDGYDMLQDVLIEAGLAKSPQPYDFVVETSFALEAMREG